MKKTILFYLFYGLLSTLCFSQNLKIAPNHTKIEPVEVGKKVSTEGYLKNLEGKKIPFSDLIIGKGKKTLIIFYRGGWCPFCNKHLADLRHIVEPLKKEGIEIIAISPDSQKRMENMVEKHKLSYDLYSDFSSQLMSNFGIGFYQSKTVLPVPSVFLVNGKGKILFAHSNPEYTKRLSNEKILEAIK